MEKFPIILLASERSGTNLLRAILSTHSRVVSPPPCGLITHLAEGACKYLSPLQESHLKELVEDCVTLTQVHLNKWDIPLDTERITNQVISPSFWKVFQIFNEMYCDFHGGDYWLTKEPELFHYAYELLVHMPNVKFVYLVRDGRDVAASMLKGGLHEQHIYNAARRWSEDQRKCLNILSDPLMRDRVFMLKYEDLVENPESVIRSLMNFIGLEYELNQLNFYNDKKIKEHAKKNEFWKNVAKPIDSANTGKYRKFLSQNDIAIFESVAWQEMRMLKYPLENSTRPVIKAYQRAFFKVVAYWKRRKMKRSDKRDKTTAAYNKRAIAIDPILNRFFDS